MARALFDAEVRLGELFKAMEKTQGRNQYTKEDGYTDVTKLQTDCAGDDVELTVQIVRHVLPEFSRKFDAEIKRSGLK